MHVPHLLGSPSCQSLDEHTMPFQREKGRLQGIFFSHNFTHSRWMCPESGWLYIKTYSFVESGGWAKGFFSQDHDTVIPRQEQPPPGPIPWLTVALTFTRGGQRAAIIAGQSWASRIHLRETERQWEDKLYMRLCSELLSPVPLSFVTLCKNTIQIWNY